jgi:hypothetical protein
MKKPEAKPMRPILSATFIALSVGHAVVFATGLLTISLSLLALAKGTNAVEYYQYVFPRFRGPGPGMRIPLFGYVVFVMYVGCAASIAIRMRQRIAGAWSDRHRVG